MPAAAAASEEARALQKARQDFRLTTTELPGRTANAQQALVHPA